MTFTEALQISDPIFITQFKPVKNEVAGYFTSMRVERDTLPDGWYAYDLRDGDDGEFCTIEPFVLVNHGGTILLQEPLTFPEGREMLELLDFEETNAETAHADYTF